MQDYSTPSASRNQVRAAEPVIPGKVSVPFPQTANQPQGGSNKAKPIPGFTGGGVKPGKV